MSYWVSCICEELYEDDCCGFVVFLDQTPVYFREACPTHALQTDSLS
jgi:hypothetical protein